MGRMTAPTIVPCPECGGNMRMRSSRFGKFWGCEHFPRCQAKVGAHPDGRPLGTPANYAGRQARIRAHEAFDTLWKTAVKRGRARAYAYLALQELLQLTPLSCHIGLFDVAQCARVVELVKSGQIQKHMAARMGAAA
jgi:hypothetical protein